MSDPWLEQRRQRIFAGEDRDLYLHLGYYLLWFAAVESKITFIIAILTKSKNLENFEILASGLGPRKKVERLNLLAAKTKPIGRNLKNLLDQFADTHIPLRNKLSHRKLEYKKLPDTYAITTLAKTTSKGATIIKALDFFERGYWLHNFNDDLQTIVTALLDGGNLEIDDPKTPLHREETARPERTKRAAPGKRDRKRLRKAQSPRAKPVIS